MLSICRLIEKFRSLYNNVENRCLHKERHSDDVNHDLNSCQKYPLINPVSTLSQLLPYKCRDQMKWNPMGPTMEVQRKRTRVGDNVVARGDISRVIYIFISLSRFT